jgi:hypothetical protein
MAEHRHRLCLFHSVCTMGCITMGRRHAFSGIGANAPRALPEWTGDMAALGRAYRYPAALGAPRSIMRRSERPET